MEYNFREVEKKWQAHWAKNKTFKAVNPDESKILPSGKDLAHCPKYYVLDMFPYPSGAGLHVGHPLGYIASDIYSRYKRHKGFNVLHPMGYDSFGLPAEQYAIQTGQHPKVTTQTNIARYREQLDKLGFSFDWDREIKTSDPEYYKWTQWIFIQLFNTWYNPKKDKAESIETLIKIFETEGFKGSPDDILTGDLEIHHDAFSHAEWINFSPAVKEQILQEFRLAYLSDTMVNWCPKLGCVLANEEVKDGFSERGGFPVERKLMRQWCLRITAYADRLLADLEKIDWSESIKESQRNWIGKSTGASIEFNILGRPEKIEVFTTRPETIFGVSFLTLAPEHALVKLICTNDCQKQVNEYIDYSANRSERERMSDVKSISGVFTGAYAEHPFTGNKIPIWIGDYVLIGYGTGAVMAVPAHDSRDFSFASYFDLQKFQVIDPGKVWDFNVSSYDEKNGTIVNSGFINGLSVKEAQHKIIESLQSKNMGKGKTNYRLRDAIFGRQRYWGEPIPVYFENDIPKILNENELPLELPEVDKYLPTETGEPPLARAKNWKYKQSSDYEYSTMPGWAGSSWYYLRYMDTQNKIAFADSKVLNYWKEVDLYIGGSEHATGHLLYVRFWTKFLFDLGLISIQEPVKKLINQGMIQGTSSFVYKIPDRNVFISYNRLNGPFNESELVLMGAKENKVKYIALHVDVNFVYNNILDKGQFKSWREEYADAVFIDEPNGDYICGSEVEKMSKSKWNVVSPDKMCEEFGADCLRLYEMFLGPIELSKPWNTNGITGVSNFLRKLWRLYHSNNGVFSISEEPATKGELKSLHKTIKKITDDIERFSFNTSVSNFMICVNELTDLKCSKREVLEPLAVLISPYAPHIAEELWENLGFKESIAYADFPVFKEEYLKESEFNYPVSFNGKTKFNYEFSLAMSNEELESAVLDLEATQKILDGKTIKKIIIVPGKIINIVA